MPAPSRVLVPILALFAGLGFTQAARSEAAPEGMVLVDAGPFTMGADDGLPDEKPAHRVTLPAFYIDRTEVTIGDYAQFVAATGHPAPPDWAHGQPDLKKLQQPVVNVTWYDANAYARWAKKRLPAEAEWEKAARGPDGRILPWGSEWVDGKANLQNNEDKEMESVGRYPAGASPCGALDMIGNAWEWTADWYRAYPGNRLPSVHYGEKYRVVKGLGGIDFYPPLNQTKRASTRGRIQPFGRYDSVGFRCVVDAGEPRRIAAEVVPLSQQEKPVPPRIETPAEVAARYRNGVTVQIADTTGVARKGTATFGLPFPEGAVKEAAAIRTGTPVQVRPLATWRDGTIRWALLDVPASVKAHGTQKITVRWSGSESDDARSSGLRLTETPDGVRIHTGVATVEIRKGSTRWLSLVAGSTTLDGPDDRVEAAEANGAPVPLTMQPPSKVWVEDRGPVRARVRVEGWLTDAQRRPVVRYRCRVDARAGTANVGLLHTFTHLSPRKMLLVKEYTLDFRSQPGPARAEFGGAREVVRTDTASILEQLSGTEYSVRSSGLVPPGILKILGPGAPRGVSDPGAEGTRAEGWISFGAGRSCLVAVKHFWQQFPKSISHHEGDVEVALWAGKEPFDADQGLSKSHELMLSVDAAGPKRAAALADLNQPLFGVAPADWYCATRGLGVLAPYSLSKYPQYETEVEAACDLENRQRPYGMRNFGDNYFGGPYKGINAFQDLEYDVSYNQFMQFARTGARKYLDTGILEARHGGDVDLKHDNGPQWKHSPRHTTTEAELGHVFCRGLVASTWLTGNPEGLENARIIGDWLIGVVRNPRSQGNERQIGWALYALTGIYEATWDHRYLDAMKANVDRLLAGQDNLGRFSIRYDNRISFFYGITLSGFVKYYEVTGDERIVDSIRRIVTRLHGFYPEYAGRTLEGLAWLYMRTGDPEVRRTCQRTWESTMTYRPFDIGGMTIFTTRFLPSVETLGLACPEEWKIPETGPREDGMHRHHYRASSGTLYLEAVDARKAVDLVLLRHVGPSPAIVRVADKAGKQVAIAKMPASGEPLAYVRLRLPPGGPYRVELRSDNTRGWDLLTEQTTRRVFYVPDWQHMEALTPRVYFRVPQGAKEIALTLEAEKEGFKGAVLYDPEGNVAGALEKFIDYGDEKHYQYPLRVDVPAGAKDGLWSLDLHEVSVSHAQGMLPYVSTNPDAFFLPSR